MAARVILLGVVAVAVVAVVIWGIVKLYEHATTTDLESEKLDHERRMERERRDYETVMEYADEERERDRGGGRR